MNADAVTDALGKKIGPLPAGAWLLGIGGGIAVAVFVRRGAQDQEVIEAADQLAMEGEGGSGWDQPDPGGTTPGVGNNTGGPNSDGSYPQDPTGANPTAATNAHVRKARNAQTNRLWRSESVAAMVSQGFQPGPVDVALDLYLHGRTLTGAQQATVTYAIALCGPPPIKPPRQAGPGGGKGHTTGHGPQHKAPSTKDQGKR